jgi:hypothetical protein
MPAPGELHETFLCSFVVRGGLADRLLAARRDVAPVAEHQLLAQFKADATSGTGRLEPEYVPLDRASLR